MALSHVKFKKWPCRMSISSMSHVKFKKWPCRPVKFRGQGPLGAGGLEDFGEEYMALGVGAVEGGDVMGWREGGRGRLEPVFCLYLLTISWCGWLWV